MTTPLWALSATELLDLQRRQVVSAREIAASVLARIDHVNPRLGALTEVFHQQALAEADRADAALARGEWLGPLHGVPISVKVNVDMAGSATTEGVVALKDQLAHADSPVVASLRAAGAVVVGRNNTPAFSLRWFTDNDLHGRTLNPFDPAVTPGGSSGGAAVAVATGMGPLAHGNDYGGSIRYPAWACGVVGLRTTVGRVPSYKATAPNRIVSNQHMSVQGPLTRTVADARLALSVMAQGSPLDPQWVPVPLELPPAAKRVALFRQHPAYATTPAVQASLVQAADWLHAAGYDIEEVTPPHFEEAADLWLKLVFNDMRRGGQRAIETMGDASVQAAFAHYLAACPEWDRDAYLDGLTRRFSIAREWQLFFERYPVLLMPNSWQPPFPVDEDTRSPQRMQELLAAQSPLLATAMLGLPGLSVPTGLHEHLPAGVQIVTARFREDVALMAGECVEDHAQFNACLRLPPTAAC